MDSIKLFIWRLIFRICPGYRIRNFYFFHVLKNPIGKKSSLHHGVELYCVGGITIGESSTINKYVDIDGRGGLYIGNNASISAYVKILTASHDPNSPNFQQITKPIKIEDYVWIGTGAIILPGVTLCQGCIVAAGSIVTKNVECYTIVAGNPARKIGERAKNLAYSPFWRPIFQ